MDFTSLYTEMCEKAKDLQQKWNVTIGDYYCDKTTVYRTRTSKEQEGAICVVEEKTLMSILEGDFNKAKSIWLPRQDQLQEMLDFSNPLDILAAITAFVKNCQESNRDLGNSMEQLLLTMYYSKKYSKVWSGGEWA